MTEKIKKRNVIVLGNHNLETYKDHSLHDYVLRVIWREHQISRADIARKLGLSRSTVTEIVKDLLKTEFVSEVGIGKSSGGRKPVVLEFQDDAKFILGVDIGATHVFFFSSRRRHTRSKRDWSSDVCSSDLSLFPKMLLLLFSKIQEKSGVRSPLAF